MAQKESKSKQPIEESEFVGDPFSGPSIYIDGMQGAIGAAGNMKINLYQIVQNVTNPEDPKVCRVIVGRLVLSPDTLVGVHEWLSGIVEDIQRDQKVQKEQRDADS